MAMSEETKAEILRAWNAGSSAAQIAKALGGRYTRNQIVGLIHRSKAKGLVAAERGEDDTPPAAPVVPLPRPAPPPAPAVARPAAAWTIDSLCSPAPIARVAEAPFSRVRLTLELPRPVAEWLGAVATASAARGGQGDPAAIAASMLAEIARDDAAAEAA